MTFRFRLMLPLALAFAGPALARPFVWMSPPGKGDGQVFRDLLDHPDAWATARSRIDGFQAADHVLNEDFNDADLRRLFAQLKAWHLKLGFEIGALKPWGPTADQTFPRERRFFDRFLADGARIDSVAMDEPLKFAVMKRELGDEYAVREVARFVTMFRHAYPRVAVGDIEPMPGIQPDRLLAFVDGVNAQLHQAGVRGLDFVRIDPNWATFIRGSRLGDAGWRQIQAAEAGCRQRGIAFSLIYWASNMNYSMRAEGAGEAAWEQEILYEFQKYRAAGGMPDQVVIQSWLHSADNSGPEPRQTIPETEPNTFTHSVIALTDQIGR